MSSGIYQLNFSDDSFYIGRSINIEARFRGHKSDLRQGKHNFKMLQTYNKYGLPINYTVLEECDIYAQVTREIYWINKTEAIDFGLNISTGGEDILVGENNPSSKYSNIQIIEVFKCLVELPNMTAKDIEILTNVNISVIKDISSGTKHTWLMEEYPEEYAILLSNKTTRKLHSLANLTKEFQFKRKLAVYPKIVSPEGINYQVDNLTEFAKLYNLHIGNLSSVLNGNRKTHKGWKLAN